MTSKPKVAFIGLGAMGIGMALHLLEDGFAVAGFDLNSKALETLKSKGGIAAASPRESADGASVLVCVVGNADQCKSALLAESTGAAWGLPQDAVIVLCSTVPPEFPKRVQSWLDNDFNRPDIKVIDCPISGGTVRAAQGKLTIFCSGSKEALRQANAVLSSTSQYLYEITGGLGWASKVKLVNQQLAGIHIAVAAEAMGLAAALGLDTLEVYDSVIGTPANSWMFQNRVPHMLADDWTPHSALQIFVKDMGIVTAEGRSWKFPLFLSSVSEQLYLLGARMGFGHEDDSGVVRTFSPQEPSAVALSKIKLKNASTTGYEDILLIHELLETVHTAAAVEALALGIKMGLSATDVVPLIANAAGSSESFRTITEKILAGDFSTGKTIIEGCTKLEKIVARAREFRYPLHLTGTTLQLYQLALLQGHSSRNEAALLKLWPLPAQPRQQQTYESLPLAQTLAALPEFQHSTEGLRDTIQQKVQSRSDLVLVILDDDPTGTQTCHDINVLTMWDIDILSAEFSSGSRSFFILTNTRALPSAMARKLVREILTNVRQAALAIGKQFEVILRGDSTLRGHLLEEMESYIDILGPPDAWILAPFFQQGGRLTINDVHYVAENGLLIPAANTAFASDKTFGYHSSNLLEYVQEKAGSLFSPSGIVSISLEDIRERGEAGVAKKVAAAPKGSVIVVNAVRDEDMLIFCSALFEVQKSHNRRFGYRVAASFVSSCLGLTCKEPILPQNLPGFQASNHSGGLILAGSYVPKTTSQLQSLIQHRGDNLEVITVEVPTLIKESSENPLRALIPKADSTTVQKIIDEVSQLLAAGRDVLVMTSRQVVTAGSNYARTGSATDLDINNLVAQTLVHILRRIKIRPRYILSKGGVTSSDAATAGLGMKRARVLGQAAPGIPLWWCDKNSDFKSVDEGGREPILDAFGTNLLTRLPLIVFPGNVGGVDSLSELVEQWAV